MTTTGGDVGGFDGGFGCVLLSAREFESMLGSFSFARHRANGAGRFVKVRLCLQFPLWKQLWQVNLLPNESAEFTRRNQNVAKSGDATKASALNESADARRGYIEQRGSLVKLVG